MTEPVVLGALVGIPVGFILRWVLPPSDRHTRKKQTRPSRAGAYVIRSIEGRSSLPPSKPKEREDG